MSVFASLLSRLWHGLRHATGKEPQEEAAKEAAGQNKAEDLTVIRGIGIATQDKLYKAGIKTYAALAGARAEELIEALGNDARSAKIERWIAQARELARLDHTSTGGQ